MKVLDLFETLVQFHKLFLHFSNVKFVFFSEFDKI